ncbi:MAG: LysM peptidoglycan-binding domain-containing protein [Syntrophales bacterium]
MKRVQKITYLFILAGVMFCAYPALAETDILNIRHWAAPDHTRVVIDVSDDVSYTVDEADKKLSIDLKETCVREDFPHEFILNKPGIDKIMITPLPQGIIRVELSLGENVETKVFKQKRFQDKPDRIVIDIEFPDVEKQESKKRGEEKALRKNKIIVIDPGHGGDDPGAIGKLKTQEKNVVLDISRKLRDILNSREGYRAFLTRDGDYYVPFKKRLKIAREYGADLFVSVHADAFRHRGARGSSVYCLSLRGASSEAAKLLARNENMADIIGGSPNGESSDESDPIILNMFQTNTINSSKTFGTCVLRHLDRVTQVKFRKVQEAPFIVLKLPEVPSLLVETAYISNPNEEKLLRSSRFQTEIAKAVAASVTEFLPVAPGRSPKTPKIVLTKKDDDQKSVYTADDTDKIKASETTSYTIKRGDTLDIIARKHNISQGALLKLNNMKLDDPLYFGRVLKVPAPEKEISDEKKDEEVKVSATREKSPPPASSSEKRFYMVKKGDTLDRIAKRNNTTIGVLLELNKMKLDDPLYFGRTLKIPPREKEVSDEKKDEEVKVSSAREKSSAPAPSPITRVYMVKRGDTLDEIARKNNTKIGVLLKLNHMKLDDPLYFGRALKVPVREKEISGEKKDEEVKVSATREEPPPPAPSTVSRVYVVEKGDTLETIARRNNTTIGALLKLNKMKLQEPLYAGRKLRLPHAEANAGKAEKAAGRKAKASVYRVKKGDTLDKIARQCDTNVNELRRLNKIRRADLLYVDQKLRLPPS